MGGVGRSWNISASSEILRVVGIALPAFCELWCTRGEDECEFRGKEAFKVKGGLTVKGG